MAVNRRRILTPDRRPPLSRIEEWELTACALPVIKQHGEGAALYIAERIGALALANDHERIATWKAIVSILDQMTKPAQ